MNSISRCCCSVRLAPFFIFISTVLFPLSLILIRIHFSYFSESIFGARHAKIPSNDLGIVPKTEKMEWYWPNHVRGWRHHKSWLIHVNKMIETDCSFHLTERKKAYLYHLKLFASNDLWALFFSFEVCLMIWADFCSKNPIWWNRINEDTSQSMGLSEVSYRQP